jgi:hypothetical protein
MKQGLFWSGAAVGALVGLLVGMSVSPVVATVVSALVGVVTAYCTATLGGGLQEALKASPIEPRRPELNAHVYLAGFSVVAFVTVLVGTYIRTHNLLAPSPTELVARWKEASFDDDTARQLVAKAYNQQTNSSLSVLIAADTNACDEMLGYIDQKQWQLAEGFVKSHPSWRPDLHGTEEQRRAQLEAYTRATCANRGTP